MMFSPTGFESIRGSAVSCALSVVLSILSTNGGDFVGRVLLTLGHFVIAKSEP